MLRRKVLVAVVLVGALGGVLPEAAGAAPWCGTVGAQDRPFALTGYPIRVFYAVPSDGADRSDELASRIWADVEEIDAWWRANDPTRTPNFDLAGFPCGLQLDLTFRRLTFDAATLAAPTGRWDRLRDDLFGVARVDATYTKYLVYYDGPVEDAGICGEAGGGITGTGLAVVYTQACPEVGSATKAVHELVHALGALFRITAPNGCPGDAAHVCDSPADILSPVAQAERPLSSYVLDVGRDDYYGHRHPWFDLQDSRWMRQLDRSARLSLVVRGRGSVQSDVPGLSCTVTCRTGWNPGSAIILLARPAPGQRFVGWSGECGHSSVRCDLLLDASAQLTALFAPLRYRLAVQVAGRGRVAGGGLTCATARCARDVVSHRPLRLRATPAKGWRLKGWTGGCRGAGAACVVTMKSATSVRATFVRG